MSESTQKLSDAGVSIWLDDLSRERLTSGNLAELIKTHNVVGVTTNPTIFAGALSKGAAYAEQMRELAAAGASVEEAVFAATCDDVRAACDVFAPVYKASNGFDGRVSIEVDPRLARDAEGTAKMARELYERVGRENVMIKIPATQEGLRPIAETLAAGISVNVTLIFSLTRYREVINAYMLGLEQALENGKDLSTIHSVASFFVSRVDTEIDARLEAAGGDAVQLKGKAGLANARLAYEVFEEMFSSERWARLQAHGANVQRPLWASTGVKDPSLPDTLYVTGLVAPNTVNTMPEATLNAVADHGEVTGNTIVPNYSESNNVLDAISVHVSYPEVVEKLEVEGLSKFDVSWEELLQTVREALEQAK
ncbi:transaldolase [Rothia sp. HMSC072B04]|jgi:transaldolase|uniref:transaldolase n=1 Tax=Rothia TaxID=32207 RepID=UPI0008A4F046|nr:MULTISPECIES: transaldolase [Rothia]OFM24236.1 transaldolase [Rothia sp. HMSC069D01]OFN74671.1 transaldolase [Rothia sp. HMSC071B01]OFP60612.1 transaldolase [Rothia sp. HMSC076D04]OFQ62166.1 transaldolase [Rothia sp. HMSC072B04]OFQ75418.1 transaldolase [Rothia sp. HMSC068E02]